MSFGVVLHWVLICTLVCNVVVWGAIAGTYVFVLFRNRFFGRKIKKNGLKNVEDVTKKDETCGLH